MRNHCIYLVRKEISLFINASNNNSKVRILGVISFFNESDGVVRSEYKTNTIYGNDKGFNIAQTKYIEIPQGATYCRCSINIFANEHQTGVAENYINDFCIDLI